MIYDNVKELADKKGLSIREVEIRAGLGNGIIGKWKTSSPVVANLCAVADVLGVTATRLMRGEKE